MIAGYLEATGKDGGPTETLGRAEFFQRLEIARVRLLELLSRVCLQDDDFHLDCAGMDNLGFEPRIIRRFDIRVSELSLVYQTSAGAIIRYQENHLSICSLQKRSIAFFEARF
jgi:hypothetical protein